MGVAATSPTDQPVSAQESRAYNFVGVWNLHVAFRLPLPGPPTGSCAPALA